MTPASTGRRRRLRAGICARRLEMGDAINDCAVVCEPFVGRRVASFSIEPAYGMQPTLAAAQWADSHRRLNAAARAATER